MLCGAQTELKPVLLKDIRSGMAHAMSRPPPEIKKRFLMAHGRSFEDAARHADQPQLGISRIVASGEKTDEDSRRDSSEIASR